MIKNLNSEASEKLKATLELMGLSFDLKKQKLRREYPNESPEQIAARFQEWLLAPKEHVIVPDRYLQSRRKGTV